MEVDLDTPDDLLEIPVGGFNLSGFSMTPEEWREMVRNEVSINYF